MLESIRRHWLSNTTRDLLSGTVVALALIPEAIAFSILAGVDPAMGLYASFCIAVVASFTGGRPAMISAATGAMALVVVSLVRDHGPEYLLAATVLTGVIQLGFYAARLARYIRFVPAAVMTGFVNALAILIFAAQIPQVVGVTWVTWAMVAAGLGIIYGFPRLTRALPAPLVAIVALTAVSVYAGLDVRTVGDMGALPDGLPFWHLPAVPLNLQTLEIVLPYALSLAVVGLIESLLTARIVDDLTETDSNKHLVARGQGLGNIVAGLFGGMAGCAMIGQSMINVTSGGRTRLSTLWAGLFLLGLIVGLGDVVAAIPMPALVAVMVMVSVSTFDWASLRRMAVLPASETVVMLTTVAVTIWTHDLSKGVAAGVVLSAVFFARVVAKKMAVTSHIEDGRRVFAVDGQLFFVSTDELLAGIDFGVKEQDVVLDLSRAHIWDGSAVGALDKIVMRLRDRGRRVEVRGLNPDSNHLIDRLGMYHRPDAQQRSMAH